MATALSDLRRTRRAHRLGDTEWFDLAYRVYLAGIFGGSAIIIASDWVGDDPLGATAIADVFRRGPAVLGLLTVFALAAGLRGGAEGGPVSLEPADVHHLLLAPVPRATVLRRPLLQRVRAVVLGGALAGAVAGLLAAQRLPGTPPAWTLSGAGFGACVGSIAVATAAIAHAARLRVWSAGIIGALAIAWQAAAVATDTTGPADTLGSLAFWGFRQRAVDLAGVAVAVALTVLAVGLAGRLRVEHLARRGALVSQLRFAVTMQDLRTVVLLRRQLRQEQPRRRPWIRLPARDGSGGSATVRRSVHGLARTPAARLGRMLAVGAGAGIAAGMAARGTTAAVVACGMLLFVVGLDLIEPLSQEVDHPDRTGTVPRSTGWLHERLLVGPVLLAVPVALVGALACLLVAPASAPAALTLAVPVTWAGMTGAVVNAVRDDHEAASSGAEHLIAPPEVAGLRNVLRTVLPVAVSTLGTVTVLAVRAEPDTGMVLRCLVGLLLYLALVRWWIVHRAELRDRWQAFAAGAAA